ncbi:hypothetical protein GALMADRAFT_239398 [Galerina marginata CBS 339.88]|uniref:Zinc-ribbon 15 domain-containing protein n=1 Tax=Galerina marginata (strain CBS 339.88) TaxID=685588 RepID=A0A067TNK6_GALM3|nr:hypothetical protein GALMADRAFT_239398 [Galerina marginata CBS 339.88]
MCIPIIFGCPTKLKPEGEEVLRVCPRCHNATVFAAKSTMWFELFWVPLIPFAIKHVLVCGTCQWNQPIPKDQINQPIAGQPLASVGQSAVPPNQPGYQPAYVGQTMPKV